MLPFVDLRGWHVGQRIERKPTTLDVAGREHRKVAIVRPLDGICLGKGDPPQLLGNIPHSDESHVNIAFSSASPAAISPSSASMSAMISSGGRCSTSSYSISL